MCGIAGIYSLKSKVESRKSEETIKRMADSIAHRGPDDSGVFVSDKIALGHRRLSILDLSPLGHQPMTRGDLVIVFNGEIYNYLEIREELKANGHQFKSSSDTEVILASYQEWGEQCLAKFNGMWAFAIYDQKNDIVFASRDRLGVKPFYYYKNDEEIVFASEIKALLAHPRIKPEPNEKIIRDYLAGGLVNHTRETFFQGIQELPPGHYLIVQKSKVESRKYWDIQDAKADIPETESEQIKHYRELFLDAVKIRLRSDVPIGTCLSGGLDSSAIVMVIDKMMQESGGVKQIGAIQKTFSAVYKDRNALYADESEFIREVTEATHAESFFIYPSGADLAHDIDKLCKTQDEPFASTSMYAQNQVFKLVGQNQIKVVLDGQGSDELLGGYHTFVDSYFEELIAAGKFGLFIRELKAFSRNQKKNWLKVGWSFWTKNYLAKFAKAVFGVKDFANRPEYEIFEPEFLMKYRLPKFDSNIANPFQAKSYNLLNHKMLPGYLRYEDRNSMAYSVESRLPFLDYRLVEYTFNLPSAVKFKNGQTKWILREALKDILPEKILARHDKMGFTVPEVYWMKNDLRDKIIEVFKSERFNRRGLTKPGAATKLFESFLASKIQNYQLIWRLFNLEIWFREYID